LYAAIPIGSKIVAEQIMVVQFPKESTPDGAFESPEKLAGRVAVVNIAAKEPITESRLAPEGTAAGLSAIIPEGYRAMTVKVDDAAGISGFITPGALVDVVVVIDPREGSGMQDPISKIPEYKVCAVRVRKAPGPPEYSGVLEPQQ
jgi:pilus assembly protein CpaB